METNPQTFWEKLASYVSGNASADEKAWIGKKSNEAKENDEALRKAEQVWVRTALPVDTYEPDVDKGWQRLQLRVQARTIAAPASGRRANQATCTALPE